MDDKTPQQQPPLYESNLIWGPIALGTGIILTVVAGMKHDLRWLLIIAWPCFGLSIWWFARRTREPFMIAVLGIIVAGALLLGLGFWLRPTQDEGKSLPTTSTTNKPDNSVPVSQTPLILPKPLFESHLPPHTPSKKDIVPKTGSIVQRNSGGVNVQQGTTGNDSPIINSPINVNSDRKIMIESLPARQSPQAIVWISTSGESEALNLAVDLRAILLKAGWDARLGDHTYINPGVVIRGIEIEGDADQSAEVKELNNDLKLAGLDAYIAPLRDKHLTPILVIIGGKP